MGFIGTVTQGEDGVHILIDTIKQDMIDRFKKITDDEIMISRDTNVQL